MGAPTAKPQTTHVKDSDVATNEALLAHAEYTRTAKSWLSAGAFGDGDDQDTPENNDEKAGIDAPSFKAKRGDHVGDGFNSDMGGLGFVPPKDAAGARAGGTTDATTIFLRKQLLGTTRPPALSGAARHARAHAQTARSTRNSRARHESDDGDDEDSRSGLGKAKPASKKQLHPDRTGTFRDDDNHTGDNPFSEGFAIGDGTNQTVTSKPSHLESSPSSQRKRATSYLDEILAKRAKKKKKKHGSDG